MTWDPHSMVASGRMLKKSSSFVLASFRPSTYPMGKEPVSAGSGRVGENDDASPARHCRLTISAASANMTLIILRVADLAAAVAAEQRVLARRGWAGENDGLFDHPVGSVLPYVTHVRITEILSCHNSFFAACWSLSDRYR
jgi:hypothetical protein